MQLQGITAYPTPSRRVPLRHGVFHSVTTRISIVCLRGIIEVTPTLQPLPACDVMSSFSGKDALFRPKIVPTYNQTPVLSYCNELSLWHSTTQLFVSIVWKRTLFRPFHYILSQRTLVMTFHHCTNIFASIVWGNTVHTVRSITDKIQRIHL